MKKKAELISIAINADWFKRLCNVNPTWSVDDAIMYVNKMQGGGRTQMLIRLGEECLKQMEDK